MSPQRLAQPAGWEFPYRAENPGPGARLDVRFHGSIRQPNAEPIETRLTKFWLGSIDWRIFWSDSRSAIAVVRCQRWSVNRSGSISKACSCGLALKLPLPTRYPLSAIRYFFQLTSRHAQRSGNAFAKRLWLYPAFTTSLTSEPAIGHLSCAVLKKTQR